MSNKYQQLRDLLGEIFDLEAASNVLNWDQRTYMPPGGNSVRAMQLATLQRLAHVKLTGDELGAALEAAKIEVASLGPDSDEARIVRKTERDLDRWRKVPSEWVSEFYRITALAEYGWARVRANADFAQFQPHLEQVVELRRQYIEFFAPYDHPYDPLLDYFEPGMKTSEVKAVFDKLPPQQVDLVQDIAERGAPVDDSMLNQPFDEDKQWDFGIEVVKALGYDFECGRQDKTVHPFTIGFGVGDVRITTR